jgi:hypothetical protein
MRTTPLACRLRAAQRLRPGKTRLHLEHLEQRNLPSIGQTVPLPAPTPITPLGSLIYQTQYPGRTGIDFLGDSDSFTINVTPPQTITVLVHPTGSSLQPTIQLFDPGNTLLSSATAPAAGQEAVLQTAPANTSGTYKVTVGGASGTLGTYTVQVYLNTALQAEAHGGPRDDTRTTAQDLSGAFLSLGGGADRAAVLGTQKDSSDFYSFHLDAGQSITLGAVAPASANTGLFGSPAFYGTDPYPYAMTVGDVNGDGIPDIVTGNLNGTVSVLLGKGDGTFKTAVNYNTGISGNFAVVLADLRHNGKSDILVTDLSFSGRVAVLLNKGDGTFAAPSYFATDSYPYALAVGDINGDGKLGIVTANYYGTVSVLLGNGDGTFKTAVNYSAGSSHYFHSIALADLRGTGKPDIVAANSFGNSVSVLLNKGDGTFGTANSYTTDFDPYALAVGDVNGDGKLDIVTGNFYNTASVLLGNGDGTFAAHKEVNTGLPSTYSVAVGDVNADGKVDIITEAYNGTASVVLGNGDGSFGAPTKYSTGGSDSAYGMALADLRSTGLLDVVSAYATYPGSVTVLLNQTSRFDLQLQDAAGTVLADAMPGAANVDHSTGFASHGDLTANGSTAFSGSAARLTSGGTYQAGSLFATNRVRVDDFNTSFTFQARPGTTTLADGLTFTIQGNSPTALGPYGGGLGYGPDQPNTGSRGIRNSLAIKFDFYNNAGEGSNSTGLFTDGRSPTVPESGSGDVLVDLTGTGIDLGSQHPFQVDLSYDGKFLTERITDLVTRASYTTSYTVDIPGLVGGTSAYVGFTAGTAGLSAIQDILSWSYQVSNLDDRITNFVAPVSGTYYAHVTGIGRDYSLVLTRNADFDTKPNNSFLPSPAQYLVPTATGQAVALGAVGYAGNLKDIYEVSMQEGQTLVAQTATPGAGAQAFGNALDPWLNVYDPNGHLVASDDNSAPDGHNARVSYTIPTGGAGLYFVEVKPSPATATPTTGEYILTIQGPTTPTDAPFTVTATNPPNKAYLGAVPTTLTVSFNHNLLLTSLAASDLTADGQAATGFTVLDGSMVTFTLPTLPNQEVHTISMAGGLLKDASGRPLTDYFGYFLVNTVPPNIISSSIQENDEVQSDGTLTCTLQFSEPPNPTTVTPAAFTLHENGTNQNYTPTSFSYIIDTSTLVIAYAGLHDDFYKLTANSGLIKDYFGLQLDGETVVNGRSVWPIPPAHTGNGIPGGDFTVDFALDVTASIAYPTPLNPVNPPGSLIYQGDPFGSTILQSGEQDTFTLNVAAGQTVTVLVHPTGTTLQPTITVTDPNNNSSSASASAAGKEAILQTFPAGTTGTYTITVGGASGTNGSYTVQVFLNTALQAEAHGGAKDDTRATAQDLSASFLVLPKGASRGAVLGTLQDGNDYYSFHLDAGQSVALGAVLGTANPNPFGAPTFYPTGQSFEYNIAAGDVNGDGKTDVVVTNYSSNTVSVLLGNGDGTFQTPKIYSAGFNPIAVALADLRGNGKLDIVVTDYYNSTVTSGGVSVLLNNGNGTFGSPTTYTVGATGPQGLAVGDLNGDGKPDIVVTNNILPGTVSVLLNKGDGTFGARTDYAAGSDPEGVTLADLRGTGKNDIIVGDYYNDSFSSGAVSVLLNNGSGTGFSRTSYTTGGYGAAGVTVGDLHGNGKLDIVVANKNGSNVSVLPGNGNGTFGARSDYITDAYPLSVAVGDINGDGKLDIVTANLDGYVSTLLNNGNGTFGPHKDYSAALGLNYSAYSALVLADFNGDNLPDLAVSNYYNDNVAVLLNQTTRTGLELQDSNGNVVRTAASGPTNLDLVTSDYVAPTSGTYYIHFSGVGRRDYNLVVTTNAAFDTEAHGTFATAQDISVSHQALGFAKAANRVSSGAIRVAIQDGTYAAAVVNELQNYSGFTFDVHAVPDSGLNTVNQLRSYDAVVLGEPYNTISTQTAAALRAWKEAGLGAVVATAGLYYNRLYTSPGAAADLNALVPLDISSTSDYESVSSVTIISPGHPVTQGVSSFIGFSGESSFAGSKAGAMVLARDRGAPTVIVSEANGGRSVWLAPAYFSASSGLSTGNAQKLLAQAVAWAAQGGVDEDWYKLGVTAGQTLTFLTTTPADDPGGEFHNTLSPHIQLYDPSGNLVASGTKLTDGRNDTITYTALVSGSYRIKVAAENGTQGEYFLDPVVTGSSQAPAAGVAEAASTPVVVTRGSASLPTFSAPPLAADPGSGPGNGSLSGARTTTAGVRVGVPLDSSALLGLLPRIREDTPSFAAGREGALALNTALTHLFAAEVEEPPAAQLGAGYGITPPTTIWNTGSMADTEGESLLLQPLDRLVTDGLGASGSAEEGLTETENEGSESG